jgi:serine/threonine-protein kinase
LNIGDTVAQKYEILSLLGQGGMGAVYEARHKGTGRRVAVKIITAAYLDRDDPRIKRFQREARAAGAIESQHIAQVLDLGEEPSTGAPYMVMEHLKGEDLQALIDRVGPLPPEVALRIVGQACLGLQKAHNAGVVHRDIKPANVFLTRGEAGDIIVKLLDFGIAKIKADTDKITQTSGGLTSTGSILGSPLFMSPEQVRNAKEIDHRTDIWSLGIVLYCALAGKPPFSDVTSIVDLLVLMSSEEPEPIRRVAPWVSEEIAAIVHGAASLEPDARFPTATAFLDRIRPLVSGDLRIAEETLGALSDAVRNAQQALSDTVAVPAGTNPAGDPSLPNTGDLARNSARSAPAPRASSPGSSTGPTTGPQVVVHVEPTSQGDNPRVSVVSKTSMPSISRPGSMPDIGNDATVPVGSVPESMSAPPPAPSSAAGPLSLQIQKIQKPRRNAVLLAGGAAAVGLIALVIGLALRSPASAPPSELPTSAQTTPAPTAKDPRVEPAPTAKEAPSDGKRTVKLVIVPGDAEVEVEGQRTPANDGVIDLVGALGSVHRVRIRKGKAETQQDVIITEIGAMPPKLEIAAAATRGGPLPKASAKSKLPAEIIEKFQ